MKCSSQWERAYVENNRPEAPANSPRQHQSKLRVACSLGQPRPLARGVLAGHTGLVSHIGAGSAPTEEDGVSIHIGGGMGGKGIPTGI